MGLLAQGGREGGLRTGAVWFVECGPHEHMMALLPMPALSIVHSPPSRKAAAAAVCCNALSCAATRCTSSRVRRSAAPFLFVLRGLVHPFGAPALRIKRLALSMPTWAYPMARTPRRA